jgi:hypothetical protein
LITLGIRRTDTFNGRHADDVAVFWPGQPDPTRGVHNHRQESIEFFKMFPDNHLANNPYKILIAEEDYTCSVADFTGTFKGPMKGLDGKLLHIIGIERTSILAMENLINISIENR